MGNLWEVEKSQEQKGEKEIKNYFSDGELACPHCGFLNFRRSTRDRLNEARAIANTAFNLNSACRCPIHNLNEGGKKDSSHIATESIEAKGVDIKTLTSRKRFMIIWALLEVGFNRIFIYPNHLHVDDDETKTQEVIGWKNYWWSIPLTDLQNCRVLCSDGTNMIIQRFILSEESSRIMSRTLASIADLRGIWLNTEIKKRKYAVNAGKRRF